MTLLLETVAGLALVLAGVILFWWAMRPRRTANTVTTVVVDRDARIAVGSTLKIGGVLYRVVRQDDDAVTVERL